MYGRDYIELASIVLSDSLVSCAVSVAFNFVSHSHSSSMVYQGEWTVSIL